MIIIRNYCLKNNDLESSFEAIKLPRKKLENYKKMIKIIK